MSSEQESRHSSVVERVIGNDEVGGSIPPGGTIYRPRVVAAFWSKVAVLKSSNLCWEWEASLDTKGYGQFKPRSQLPPMRAHRVAWEIYYGRNVPDGAHILHSCDNPKCCNPYHLRPGTHNDNMADKVARGRSGLGEPRNGKRV